MEPATPKGETEEPKQPLDQTPSTPPADTAKDGEIERLRKELEQKTMRENQLANQLKAKEEAEAEAKRKQAEENEEFKNLYEQEKAKREEIEAQAETDARLKELSKASDELFSDYSDEVKALAQEAGMSLSDVTDEAKAALKTKLDKISTMVTKTEKVNPNNPNPTNNKPELTPDELKESLRDPNAFHELMMEKFPGIANMTKKR